MKRIFALFAVLLMGGVAYGQTSKPSSLTLIAASDVAAPGAGPTKAVPKNDVEKDYKDDKLWSFTGGIDIQSKYIFRGFTTTKNGFIMQPYGQFAYKAYDNGDLSISPYIGTWENVTSHPYAIKNGKTNSLRWLSETDIDIGATIEYKNFTVGINYIYYLYPNGSIAEDQEIGVTVAYDDSEFFKDGKCFDGLHPHAAYYHEIQNRGGPEGGYIELGLEPTFKPIQLGKLAVTISTPINVGLTHDQYYTDRHGSSETFGYFEAGIKASIPLDFLNGKAGGTWSLVGEIDYWYLNAANLRALDGRSDDVTARVGVTFKY